MSIIKVVLENCNNISKGELCFEENKLNIKYGINGTGKSTISNAISLSAENNPLLDLKPFGFSDAIPSINLSKSFNNVRVFNEEFVNNMVFKENKLIDNAFDVFIKTSDYEQRKHELDNSLTTLKIDISEEKNVVQLKKDISDFKGKLEFNTKKTDIKSNTNYKAIVKKNNVYNIPDKLRKYAPFISDTDICINWIDWKSKGDAFNFKGICPFCSEELNDDFKEEQMEFKDIYKKSDAQNLKTMLDLFENFHKYIPEEKFVSIIECIKEEKEEAAIKTILMKFLGDYFYIYNKLDKITTFDKNAFSNNVNSIEKVLSDMKIDKDALSYFSTGYFNSIIDLININLDELIKKVIDIKRSIGKLQSILKKTVSESKKDINDFLKSAGISYSVDISLNESEKAIATLQYVNKNGTVEVENIKSHLSWGERNAFSLVLFMFYAISENADLIVLDDPISSFDSNKKYAIIHRMFSKPNGLTSRSFYGKTVLMFTHDFEPIIDFGVIGKLPKEVLNTTFIRNKNGLLDEIEIDYDTNIKPVVKALATYVRDERIGIVNRIAFLRKYYEHTGIEDNKEAYDILSSLIHGREKCTYKDNTEMSQSSIFNGCQKIKEWIPEFDYYKLHNESYNENDLARMYFQEKNVYLKMQIFRAIFEINPNKEIKEDDILVKFINESYHIENDYAYYLDMVKYEMIPEYVSDAINDYMKETYSDTYKPGL
ncbi:hypothetical protein [Bulleidia sp. HCP3S3_G12]|uniref:hypothetical protein n=1 Tax=Bulleidia sp. HCP3S3_G12 TaxID=3438916 RepID=UPI003F893600